MEILMPSQGLAAGFAQDMGLQQGGGLEQLPCMPGVWDAQQCITPGTSPSQPPADFLCRNVEFQWASIAYYGQVTSQRQSKPCRGHIGLRGTHSQCICEVAVFQFWKVSLWVPTDALHCGA